VDICLAPLVPTGPNPEMYQGLCGVSLSGERGISVSVVARFCRQFIWRNRGVKIKIRNVRTVRHCTLLTPCREQLETVEIFIILLSLSPDLNEQLVMRQVIITLSSDVFFSRNQPTNGPDMTAVA